MTNQTGIKLGRTAGLLVLFSILFFWFIGFLLVSNYLSLKQLRDNSLKQYKYELIQRANNLSGFLYDHAHNMYNLSRNDKLKLHFENKALGMSMEYGLRASIFAIEHELKTFVSIENNQASIFIKGVTFVNSAGKVIAEAGQNNKKLDDSLCLQSTSTPEGFYIFSDSNNKLDLLYIQPFYFKGYRKGNLISRLYVDAITVHFLNPARTSLFTSMLYLPDLLIENNRSEKEDKVKADSSIMQEKDIERVRKKFEKNEKIIQFRVPLAYQDMEVVEFAAAKDILSTTSPGTFLLALILLLLALIVATIIFARFFTRNIALQARIKEARKREEVIELKNHELENEIRERKRLEEARLELEVQLQRAQKMESIGHLAGGVAHDFNNMLGVILGNVELALEEAALDNPIVDELKEIQTAAEHSAEITRKLLAFARRQTVSPEIINLNETAEGLLSMLKRLVRENVKLTLKTETELWPVKVDRTQADQILINLCVNAQAAISGKGIIEVETTNVIINEGDTSAHVDLETGEYVMISVSDNGTGIDKSTLPHIFEPFFTTKGVGEGSGLGLATVYGAVKQNNGYIQVSSELKKGTTFTIYFRKHINSIKINENENPPKTNLGSKKTIMLVEDEPLIRKTTSKMLEQLGYSVESAATPNDCIMAAGGLKQEIDILITDIVMPEINGRELAQRLLPNHPVMKCLFMSSHTDIIISAKGASSETMMLIQKPFTLRELDEKIRAALKK